MSFHSIEEQTLNDDLIPPNAEKCSDLMLIAGAEGIILRREHKSIYRLVAQAL